MIQAIHGPDGGLERHPAQIRYPGVWSQIIKSGAEMEACNVPFLSSFSRSVGAGNTIKFWSDIWIGQSTLQVRFPLLFSLDNNPSCLINERLLTSGNWYWDWRRAIRWGREEGQFLDLVTLLLHTTVSPNADGWTWLLEDSGYFSVNSLRRSIDNNILSSFRAGFEWNKLVPIKLNIMAWRASYDRLPTRPNLDRRGVNLHSLRCSVCDEDIESVDHILSIAQLLSKFGAMLRNGGIQVLMFLQELNRFFWR